MIYLLFVLITSNLLASTPPLWIVGKKYVGLNKLGNANYWNSFTPETYGFNEDRCELWAVKEETKELFKFSSNSPEPEPLGKADAVLSSVQEGFFLTRSGDTIEKRTSNGVVVKSFTVSGSSDWLEAQSMGEAGYALLQKKDKNVHLSFLDPELKAKKLVEVSIERDLWNVERLLFDSQTQTAWVGYTATTPSRLYAPILKAYSPDGDQKYEKEYGHRGVFWDFCLKPDHSLLFSYDIPSNSGFTVPLNSYLDSFTTAGVISKVYSADTNYFIDSVSCTANELYMIHRSIFGSDKSRVVNASNEMLFLLPDQAKKLFHCLSSPP